MTLVLLPILLVVGLGVAIYLPPVQNWLVDRVATVASEQTGWEISVEHVSLVWPLDLEVEGVVAVRPQEDIRDTVADIATTRVSVALRPLLKGEVVVDELAIDRAKLLWHMDYLELEEDEEESEPVELLARLDRLTITNSVVDFYTAGDSLHVATTIEHITATGGTGDIARGVYGLEQLDVALSTIALEGEELESIYLENMALTIRGVSADLEQQRASITSATLQTDHSTVVASAQVSNWDGALDDLALWATVQGRVGRAELEPYLAELDPEVKSLLPYQDLTLGVELNGTLGDLTLTKVDIDWPRLITAEASGRIANVLDPDHLQADVDLHARAYYIYNVELSGHATADGDHYALNNGQLSVDGAGTLSLEGEYTLRTEEYRAKVKGSNIRLKPFMADAPVKAVTIDAQAAGRGLRGEAKATVSCAENAACGTISLDALLNNDIRATLSCSLDKLDFYALGLTEQPFSTMLCAVVDVTSDLKESHSLIGSVSDVILSDSAQHWRMRDLDIEAFTRRDSTQLAMESGDLSVSLAAKGGYEILTKLGTRLAEELTREIENKAIEQDSLKRCLPIGHLRMHVGQENIFYGLARRAGYDFQSIDADIDFNPFAGINGYAQVDELAMEGFLLNRARLELATDDEGFSYRVEVANEEGNDYVFRALVDGSLFATGTDIHARLYDENGELGLGIGFTAELDEGGVRITNADDRAILGYRRFVADSTNYVYVPLSEELEVGRVTAHMRLRAEDGTGLLIESDDDNTDALQDLTLGLHNLDLQSLATVIPYFPDVQGVLSGDFHVVLTEEALTLSNYVAVDGLVYEGLALGDVATEFVYMPIGEDSHYVDGLLRHNQRDVGTLKGTYTLGEETDRLDAVFAVDKIPLEMANGFIPDQIMGLKGYGDGALTIVGPLDALEINGTLDLDSAYVYSVPYGVELRLDDRPVTINHSRLVLDNFNMYSHNDEPLVIDGSVDFADVEHMRVEMKMHARNFLLIDAKENRRSEAYGKCYVNIDATARGALEAMQIRGSLDVLGTTNLTYILRDAPITTENQMEGLVEFVDFANNDQSLDGDEAAAANTPTGSIYCDFTININTGARVFCALNTIKTNYVDIVGGGTMRMIYENDEIKLTGRYTVTEGEMKYALPIIPLKTFTIAEGSYVEFTGDVLNPTLNITATEQTRASATVDGVTQTVTFNCGVKISQTLSNMGLEFLIAAPENNSLNSELQSMSTEERNKIAVTMLTTGMYLSDNNLSSFSMNSALTSFLQNEINNISGNALRTLDLEVGLDNSTDAAGQLHTDYTFKFAKRFWNNRMQVVIGGKVSSTSASADNLFDNVALEYRLDSNSTTKLRTFYDRQTYDYLEGYVGQYGVGVVWKKQLNSLCDLWHKPKKVEAIGKDVKVDVEEVAVELGDAVSIDVKEDQDNE